jgi:hypothetical protein
MVPGGGTENCDDTQTQQKPKNQFGTSDPADKIAMAADVIKYLRMMMSSC